MNYQSDSINELVSALAKAQGKIMAANKDSCNPYYNSKFADLNSVWNACRIPLSENGLAVIQTQEKIEDQLSLVTTLAHSSGQFIKSYLPIELPDANDVELNKYGKPVKRNRLHVLGGIITYLRRYGLCSIVGIVSDEDLDGNEMNQTDNNQKNIKTNSSQQNTNAQKVNVKDVISNQEAKELAQLISNCSESFQETVWKFLTDIAKVNSFEEMNPKIYEKIKTRVLNEINSKEVAA